MKGEGKMRNFRMVISNVNGRISISAAEEAKKSLNRWARSRAKITPVGRRRRRR